MSVVTALTDDWEIRTIGSLGSVRGGKRLPKGWSLTQTPTAHPYIRVTDMQQGRVDTSELRFVPEDVAPLIRAYRIFKNDIFISVAGTLGIVGRVTADLDGANLTENADRITSITCDVDYLMYSLLGEQIQNEIDSIRTVGAQPKLALGRIKQFEIPIPMSRSEQSRIAQALRDSDDLIAALERLIVKKQAIKQGMMQRVFAAPDDQNQHAALGTMASMLSGGTPDRHNDEYWAGTIPWISATTLKSLEVATSDQAVTAKAVRAGSKMAPMHSTLVLVRGSALHSEIRASLVTAEVCFNQDVKALVPAARVEPKFLTYSIHANASRLLRLVTSAGNTAGVLDTKVLRDFEVWLPSRERQRKVVSIFDDVTAEIDALKVRLTKARATNMGMMQQLLTGRARLPVEATT